MKKSIIAGLTVFSLLANPFMPNLKGVKTVEAAVATPVPQSVPVTYESVEMEKYGLTKEWGAFKVNLGKRTGTLVLKLYLTDKNDKETYRDTLYADAKNKHDGAYALSDKNTGIYDEWKGLAVFNRYNDYPKLPIKKYRAGFTHADTTIKGDRFIALGIYLDTAINNGVYYVDMPNGMTPGTWEVKAYFYDKANVEEQLFNEIGRYFPLLGKVWWDGIELTPGQIGRLTILEDTQLYKLEGEKKVYSRTLKKGEFYRIYAFKPGMLSVGGGYYVDRDSKVEYQTPSKTKLELVQMRTE